MEEKLLRIPSSGIFLFEAVASLRVKLHEFPSGVSFKAGFCAP